MEVAGEPSFLVELLDAFKQEAPALLAGIRTAAQAGDARLLRQSAHSLKGGSSNLGAVHVQKLCAALEEMGRNGALDGVEELIAQVEREYQRAIQALEVEINQKAG
jgi:HPt (histidine-containing phosphotransfer) domain-containing protein